MKILAPLFVTDADTPVVEAVDQLLADGEGVIGLQQTGEVESTGEEGWLLVTTRRTLLLSGASPDTWQVETLAPGDGWDYDPSMARDAFRLGSRKLFDGPLIGGTGLRRVFELASTPPTERIYRAAVAHHDEQEFEDALVLFELARERLEELAAQDDSLAPQLHEAVFQVARLHYQLEQPEQVKSVLEELTDMAPEDDLVRLSESAGLDAERWWELLAESHAAAGDSSSAASVYGILTEASERANRHVLAHARALRKSGDGDAALECYWRYLEASRPPGSFDFLASSDDQEAADAWLDVAVEATELARELEDTDRGFDIALEIVRVHPFAMAGYEHLLELESGIDAPRHRKLDTVRQILALLDPEAADRLGVSTAFEPAEADAKELPALDEPVGDDVHDEQLTHPEERVRKNAFGKLVGKYVVSEETSDARLHCEIIREDTYPVPFDLTTQLARLVDLDPPDVFISHQRAGIRALGQADDPFILIAMSHLDRDSERYLPPASLCFALAAQLEHIRAGHLIITEAEYHQSLKKTGIKGVFAAVEMLPLGSLLSKTPISKIGEAIGAFKERTKRKWLTGALDLAESRGGDAFGWATNKLRERVANGDERTQREALMKEHVAAFVLGALFTADRMGLLACDSVLAATYAMLRLSPTAFEAIPRVEREGLGVLFDDGEQTHRELAHRLSELFDFALSDEYQSLSH
jgi:tetratricopeptide (TPR) repeat protein